jgi:hypothetical protein
MVWNHSEGTAVTTTETSRVHQSKHQIQTLAQAAMAARMTMESQVGGGRKPKANSGAKYGW